MANNDCCQFDGLIQFLVKATRACVRTRIQLSRDYFPSHAAAFLRTYTYVVQASTSIPRERRLAPTSCSRPPIVSRVVSHKITYFSWNEIWMLRAVAIGLYFYGYYFCCCFYKKTIALREKEAEWRGEENEWCWGQNWTPHFSIKIVWAEWGTTYVCFWFAPKQLAGIKRTEVEMF